MSSLPPFHHAFPVHDLEKARHFYGEVLGCAEGRSSARWVDFNFFGHQIVAHVVDGYDAGTTCNAVDGDPVPIPHFGLALQLPDFHALAKRMKDAGVKFDLQPHVRFSGQPDVQESSGQCSRETHQNQAVSVIMGLSIATRYENLLRTVDTQR